MFRKKMWHASEKQTFLFSEKDIRGNFSDKMTRAASLTKKLKNCQNLKNTIFWRKLDKEQQQCCLIDISNQKEIGEGIFT